MWVEFISKGITPLWPVFYPSFFSTLPIFSWCLLTKTQKWINATIKSAPVILLKEKSLPRAQSRSENGRKWIWGRVDRDIQRIGMIASEVETFFFFPEHILTSNRFLKAKYDNFVFIVLLRYLGIFFMSWIFETKNGHFEIRKVRTTTIIPNEGKL